MKQIVNYDIYEVFADGTKYFLDMYTDAFTAVVEMRNKCECTQALRMGKSHLELWAEELTYNEEATFDELAELTEIRLTQVNPADII